MEYKQLILQATVDGLTGLANKITIGKFLCDKLMVRSYPDLSVIFIDLDHFKSINDTCGHPAGDFLLAETGRIIRSLIRAYDRAGRYGGEEFVIVLPDTPIDKAAIVAEKIRNVIEQHKMKYEDTEISVTASFGVSSLRANAANIEKSLNLTCVKDIFEVSDLGAADWDSIDDTKKRIADVLLNMADMALYEAKYTYCGSCGYHSENADNFINGKCSVCGSEDLTRGRNKVVMFGSGKR
jgi:diguanylate cyclase (GGDEF)-like protein